MKPKTPKVYTFDTPIESVDQLENLILLGDREFYHRVNRNADGTPQRWRINGALKRWKKDRTRMRLPIKHGLYAYDAIESLAEFNTYLSVSYTES